MDFQTQLISTALRKECPACGPDQLMPGEQKNEFHCVCCGRELIVSGETLYIQMSAEWDLTEHPCIHKWPTPPPNPDAESPVELHYPLSGGFCEMCQVQFGEEAPATHKLVEYFQVENPQRKPMSVLICCGHYAAIFPGAFCGSRSNTETT